MTAFDVENEEWESDDYNTETAEGLWAGDESEGIWDEDITEGLDEESRARARRRRRMEAERRKAAERKRRIDRARAIQRQRAQQTRTSSQVISRRASHQAPVRPTPRQAVAAIKSLDIDAQILADKLTSLRQEQIKQSQTAAWGAAASTAVGVFLDNWNKPTDARARALLAAAPLALQVKNPRKPGFGGFITQPWVVGGAAAVAIATVARAQDRQVEAARIELDGPPFAVKPGDAVQLTATAYDKYNRVIRDIPIKWSIDNSVDAVVTSDGKAQAQKVGKYTIFAEYNGIKKPYYLNAV